MYGAAPLPGISSKTNLTYAWCGECDAPRAVYKIITTTTGAPQVIEYFDSLSRQVLTETRAFDDGQWSKVMTDYNALGQVLRVSRPYAWSPSYWTVYGYDELGRVTDASSPSTGLTTTAYSKLTTMTPTAIWSQAPIAPLPGASPISPPRSPRPVSRDTFTTGRIGPGSSKY